MRMSEMRLPTPLPTGRRPAPSGADRQVERRRGVAALTLATTALLLTLAWRPPAAPPLYDGLGFPDEAYRWVSPPVGAAATGPATTLRAQLPLSAADPVMGYTAEQGPQLAVQLRPGDVVAPAGATTVTIVGAPKAVPPVPPDGTLVSNLYQWTVTADKPGAVTVAENSKAVVNLRADIATTQTVVLEAWDGKQWHQLGTNQAGADIYAAYLTSWLPVALVKLAPGARPSVTIPTENALGAGAGPSPAAAGSGGLQTAAGSGPGAGLYLGAGAILVVVAGGLLLARRRSGAGEGDPDDDGRSADASTPADV
jgi:hypothetical protein